MITNILTIKPLEKKHALQVKSLDDESVIFNLCAEIDDLCDDETMSHYGLFNKNNLIGYCTLNYADCIDDFKDIIAVFGNDTRLLTNVFIRDVFRNKGYGLYFITTCIKRYSEGQVVLLQLFNDELVFFYQKIGFETIINKKAMILKKKERTEKWKKSHVFI